MDSFRERLTYPPEPEAKKCKYCDGSGKANPKNIMTKGVTVLPVMCPKKKE